MLENVEIMQKGQKIHEVHPKPCDNLLNANIMMGMHDYEESMLYNKQHTKHCK
mgnify:CR=1 FL=1